MEMFIDRPADATVKYELMSDGIVAEVEDKLFMIFTYGPEPRYYLADIHAGLIVAAISVLEGCRCELAYDEDEGWRLDALDENGIREGSLKLCRSGIDLELMSRSCSKRISKDDGVLRVNTSDFKEAVDHGTDCRRDRDLRQNDKRA